MTKKARKALMMVLCAVALVAISVGATVAYLTSTDSVTNTFTIGKVAITLDETKVDVYGKEELNAEGDPVPRVKENSYLLVPGHTYMKNPTVHVDPDSESCYLFVKVENGIADALKGTLETQITEYSWIKLTGVDNVYYRTWTKGTETVDYAVFNSFTTKGTLVGGPIPSDAPDNGKGYLDTYKNGTIKVTAYAIQSDGFADAESAWAALQ